MTPDALRSPVRPPSPPGSPLDVPLPGMPPEAILDRVRRDVAEAGEVDWQARAEAAEAKLAAIEARCHDHWEPAPANPPVHMWVKAADILAIIGSEEEADRG